jgi:fatty acid desaturase
MLSVPQQKGIVATHAHSPLAPQMSHNTSSLVKNVDRKTWEHIRECFPHFPPLMDVDCVRKEAAFRLKYIEDWAARTFLEDKRDSIMVSLILNICLTTVPLYIYIFKYPSHVLGGLAFVFTFYMYLQRFVLMLHYSEHRKLFRNPYHSIGKYFLSGFLCMFFGIPPGMYRLHHVVMHHNENNISNEDLSSTEPYQRDNFLHFLIYVFRYFTHMLLLPLYAWRKGRYIMTAVSLVGSLSWLSAIAVGMQLKPIFTLWAAFIPMFVAGFALMFGNFSQHIFVHPSVATMPQNLNSYKFNCALTLQSINHFDNQYAFNDGYHVTHHINSRVHWTELAFYFLKNLEKYAENNVLVFNGLGFFDIGLNVMLGRLDFLADHVVHFTKEKKSKDEIIAKLKICLQPIARTNRMVKAKD